MRLTSSTHNHTNLCDGRNTPDEMARAALEAGFTDFGFSGHSYAPFDLDYSVKSEQHYVQGLRALQRGIRGLSAHCRGMEADWFAPVNDRAALDYIIGSVHYLRDEARYGNAVDGAPEALDACVAQMFGGDALAMARAYYALVAENVRKYRPEIIGHFDLVKKTTAADTRLMKRSGLPYCGAGGAGRLRRHRGCF
ncbi:MAG: PHP domain-containing protein [Ruthenibacterium lactatiformans]